MSYTKLLLITLSLTFRIYKLENFALGLLRIEWDEN